MTRVKFRSEYQRKEFLKDYPNQGLEEIYSRAQLNGEDQIYTYCTVCKLVRPERAHHCRLCNRCILKMDHHCPWVGNCVGFYNHKFFVLFCFHASLGCICLGTLLVPRFLRTFSLDALLEEVGFRQA